MRSTVAADFETDVVDIRWFLIWSRWSLYLASDVIVSIHLRR